MKLSRFFILFCCLNSFCFAEVIVGETTVELRKKIIGRQCLFARIDFSSSGEKALIQWPNKSEKNALLIDLNLETNVLVELSYPFAKWGSEDDGEIIKLEKSMGVSQSRFNTLPLQNGIPRTGITLLDENKKVLQLEMDYTSGRERLPSGTYPSEVVALKDTTEPLAKVFPLLGI